MSRKRLFILGPWSVITQMLLLQVSLAFAHPLEVSCVNGTEVSIAARYHGNATAFYPAMADPSGCYGYQVSDEKWLIESLTRTACGSQLTRGFWKGTLIVQLGGVASVEDLQYSYSCPAVIPSTVGRFPLVTNFLRHANPPTYGNFELLMVDTRRQPVTEVRLGVLIHLTVKFSTTNIEHGFTVVNCRAANKFPYPNSTYDVIIDGCGNGEVIPMSRGFITSQEGMTTLRGISASFRAFQLPHFNVIQFMCSFVICHNKTECNGDSCQVLGLRKKRHLTPPEPQYYSHSQPVSLALTSDYADVYEVEDDLPALNVGSPDLGPLNIGPADGYQPDFDTFPSHSYDAQGVGKDAGDEYMYFTEKDVEPVQVRVGDPGNREELAKDTSSVTNNLTELTVVLGTVMGIITLLLIAVISCATCLVFRVTKGQSENQPLMVVQSPYHRPTSVSLPTPENPRGQIEESTRGALLDISNITGMFSTASAPTPSLGVHAESDASQLAEVGVQTLPMSPADTELISAYSHLKSVLEKRSESLSPGPALSPSHELNPSPISLPSFDPWLVHLEHSDICSPVVRLPSSTRPHLSPGAVSSVTLEYESVRRDFTAQPTRGQAIHSTPLSGASSGISVPIIRSSSVRDCEPTELFSSTTGEEGITLERSSGKVNSDADDTLVRAQWKQPLQPIPARNQVPDMPTTWCGPSTRRSMASSLLTQQKNPVLAYFTDGTKKEVLPENVLCHNNPKRHVGTLDEKPEINPLDLPFKHDESAAKLRNRTFSVVFGEQQQLLNLPLVRPRETLSEPVPVLDSLTNRYSFADPETFPIPAKKAKDDLNPETLINFKVNPIGPPLNSRKTRRPPIQDLFSDPPVGQATERFDLDDVPDAGEHGHVDVNDHIENSTPAVKNDHNDEDEDDEGDTATNVMMLFDDVIGFPDDLTVTVNTDNEGSSRVDVNEGTTSGGDTTLNAALLY